MLLHSELFEVCLVCTEGKLKVKGYNSLSETGQESLQGFRLFEWSEGVVWNLYMPYVYVCGFARVAYVLRHAAIQDYTEVFNR